MNNTKRIVMLTGSEGRRGIVRAAGLPWLLMNSSFDEAEAAAKFDVKGIDSVRKAADYCAYLSAAKNIAASPLMKGAVIVTADTVVFNKKLLEKPRAEAEVYEMIGGLNDNPHEVITAVTVSGPNLRRLPDGVFEGQTAKNVGLPSRVKTSKAGLSKLGKESGTGNEIINYYVNISGSALFLSDVPDGAAENIVTFAAVSRVLLSGATRELIKRTIERENPYACSGGYTIDGILKPCFKILSGSEENVIGLPLAEILSILK